MNITELAELVRQMRDAQRTYFRERSPQALSVSKELERCVDRAVDDVLDKQPKLFGRRGRPRGGRGVIGNESAERNL